MCNKLSFITTTLHEHHGVSNHATPLFVELIIRCKSKKTSKLRVIGLCNGNPMAISGFPSQRASNAKNVSIWRRHCYIYFEVLNTSPLTILHIHRVNVTFSFIFQHQGYNAQTHINDIALIQLTQAVIYNRYVQNIQMDYSSAQFPAGYDCVITGWGYTRTKPSKLSFWSHHDDVIKWKHFPCQWPFVRGIHRSPADSPHNGQWLGALMFSLMCAWTRIWANNGVAGDLKRQDAHCDVTRE